MLQEEQISFQKQKTTYYHSLLAALDPAFDFGTQQILYYYKDALQFLSQVDQEFKVNDNQERQNIIKAIFKFVNSISNDCHRSQLVNSVSQVVSKFYNNLKCISFQKENIKLSCWEKYFNILPLQQVLQNVQESMRKQILTILDKQFSDYGKISILTRFLLSKPNIPIRIYNCQKCLFQQNYNNYLTLSQFYFIGILAASTYGCRYLWNQMAQKFIKNKGDPMWLSQGIKYKEIPKLFILLSQISCNLAYNMPEFMSQKTINSIIENEQPNSTKFTKSLMALCLYQMQACFCLAHGLLPRCTQYQEYLKADFNKTRKQSFIILEKFQEENDQKYNFLGQRFTKLYQKPIKFIDSDSEESQINQKGYNNQNILTIIQEQQEKTQIKDLETVKTLKKIYGKYALFNDGCFSRKSQLTPIQNEEEFRLQKNKEGKKVKYYRFDTDKYLQNKDWELNNALEVIQLRMKPQELKSIKLLMDSLKAKKQFSKNNQSYIQSLFSYFYQHVDYQKLVVQKLKPAQRYFIKVILQYPYFLNKQIFDQLAKRMDTSDLSLYIMDYLSYKMQSNILIIGKMLEKASSKKAQINLQN